MRAGHAAWAAADLELEKVTRAATERDVRVRGANG
jgi:hypothetical protein